MIGAILNASGILIGGAIGLVRHQPLSRENEAVAKVGLAAFTVFYGLRLTWMGLDGPFLHILRQLLIALLAMWLGKFTGRLLGLQRRSNELGRRAKEIISKARPDRPESVDQGFRTCAALFCAAPLGIIGAIAEGISSPPYFYPLAVKGVIDGLAALGLVSLFGWGVIAAAVPVLAVQGSLTLICTRFLQPFLSAHDLLAPVHAVGGLLIFSVALVMLGLKKIELTDYLPSLLFAPLIGWLVH